MNSKQWPLTYLVIPLALAATACQPKMKGAQPSPADQANVPEKLDISPTGLIPNGDARQFENAKAFLLNLAGTQDIEDHILIRENPSPAEQQARQQLWTDLAQEHKNVATQLLSLCQINRKQTKPDLSTLSATAQFVYGSDLHTEGAQCPATLSRVAQSQGKVLTWNKDNKSGSYRTTSSVKTVSEFQDPAHQQALGMSKGEFTMRFILDAIREGGDKRRSFLRATGFGFMILTTNNIGRVDFKYRGQELHKDGVKTTVIFFEATTGGQTYNYAFHTEGSGMIRQLKKAYVGNAAISADEIKNLKVEKLASKLSLSVN